MKQLTKVLLLILLTFSKATEAQENVTAFRWSTKKLEWSDFQEDNTTHNYAGSLARSYWKLDVGNVDTTNSFQNGTIKLKVVTYFIPSRSWVRQDIAGSKSVLAHEQLHFDIAEVFSRRLRKELSEQMVTPKNYKKAVNKIRNKIFAQERSMQKEYDQTHRQKWQEWVDNVTKWLDELKEYQSEEVLISIENK